MDHNKLQNNEFVREKIKNKPVNHKSFWKRMSVAALSGVVFSMACIIVAILMIPVIRQQWEQEKKPDQIQETEKKTETGTSQIQETEKKTETGTSQEEPLSIEDYQRIQRELYAVGNQANKSIVTITCVVSDTDWFNNSYEREGQGSGTVIGEKDGKFLILTEKKIIKNASKINVTFVSDESAPAKMTGYDGNTGLALLTVPKSRLSDKTVSAVAPMERGNSNNLHKGSVVIALGSPVGTNYSVLTGCITSGGNEISTQDCNYSVYTTDIPASRQGSGILINTKGQLIGVMMQSYGTDSASTLTAVSITELEPVMKLLFAEKEIPYIGVQASTVTDAIAKRYDIPKGVYIKKVAIDSPAMNEGLQSGDVIMKLNGVSIPTVGMYTSVLMGLTPGETYPVVVMREGAKGYKKITCRIKVGVM